MSKDMVYETVPLLSRRQGDNVVAGQNNATILLGRDRDGAPATGYGSQTHSGGGKDAGAIHMIVGRLGEDPDIWNDAASLYLSAKSDPDARAKTGKIGSKQTAVPAVIMRADCVRISSRIDFKISVGGCYLLMTSDGKIVLDGDIQLGEGAAERIIRGDTFAKVWQTHGHPTAVGMSGPPQPLPEAVFSSNKKVS